MKLKSHRPGLGNIWGIVAAVVIAVSAVLIIINIGKGGANPQKKATPHILMDKDTGKFYKVMVPVDAELQEPLRNPDTGKRKLYVAWQCNLCGEIFIPERVKGPDGKERAPMIPACPKCHKKMTGAVTIKTIKEFSSFAMESYYLKIVISRGRLILRKYSEFRSLQGQNQRFKSEPWRNCARCRRTYGVKR